MKRIYLLLCTLLLAISAFSQTTSWSSSPTVTPQTRKLSGSNQIRWIWGTGGIYSLPDSLLALLHKKDSILNSGYVTHGYFDSHTLTFNNGLTKTGSNVQLGGSLIQNTLINQWSNSLEFKGAGTGQGLDVLFDNTPGGSTVYLSTDKGNPSGVGRALINMQSGSGNTSMVLEVIHGTDNSKNKKIQFNNDTQPITITDGINNAPMEYTANYAIVDNLSIPNKGQVDSIAAAAVLADTGNYIHNQISIPRAENVYIDGHGVYAAGNLVGQYTALFNQGVVGSTGNRQFAFSEDYIDFEHSGIHDFKLFADSVNNINKITGYPLIVDTLRTWKPPVNGYDVVNKRSADSLYSSPASVALKSDKIPAIGTLYNATTITSTSDWANNGLSGMSASGGKLIITGSNTTSTDFTKSADLTSIGTTCYDKWTITATFTAPTPSATTGIIWFGMRSNNTTASVFNTSPFGIDISNTGTQGTLYLRGGTGGVFLYATSATKLTIAAGDVIRIICSRSLWTYTARIMDITNPQADVSISYTSTGPLISSMQNAGFFTVYTQTATPISINSFNVYTGDRKNPDVVLLGNSKTMGKAATQYGTSLAGLLGIHFSVLNLGGGGDGTAEVLRLLPSALAANGKVYILDGIGRNDIAAGVSLTTTEANMATIIAAIQATGAQVIVNTGTYETAVNQAPLATYTVSTWPGLAQDTYTATSANLSSVYADGIHETDVSYSIVYRMDVAAITNAGSFDLTAVNNSISQLQSSLSPITSSQTANTFMAAPDGSSGVPSFRVITKGDARVLSKTEGTGGVTDANDATNNVPGVAPTLLAGTATNMMGGSSFYYLVNYHHAGVTATTNHVQIAYPYGNSGALIWYRTYFSSAFSAWKVLIDASTFSGDATVSNAGVVALKATGTAGTYGQVTTDAQGRVTSGTIIADLAHGGTGSSSQNFVDISTNQTGIAGNKSWTGVQTVTQNALATTTSDGLLINNTTAAANNAQQISPALHFQGNGWGTTGSASQSVDGRISLLPTQGTNPSSQLVFEFARNGGAYSNQGNITSTGIVTFGSFRANVSGIATTGTDGVMLSNTTAATSGVPVQYSTRLNQSGSVWNTTATAAANQYNFAQEARGVSGTTPTASLFWMSSLVTNTTPSFTDRMSLDNSGNLNLLTGTLKTPTLTLVNIASGTAGTDSLLVKNGTTNAVNKVAASYYAGPDVVNTATDANYTITTSGQFVKLPVITANRTVSIPTASSYTGRIIRIWNQNTSGTFSWSFTGATVKDAANNTLTTLVNTSVYMLESDGTNWLKLN